ncbi:diguanylate cyclase [Salinisphaera dokdonensis CL-ES53]|uniref:diguanylate cyclase n=2 Tax=Salinisphaera TaxID=180541 RepID=A0ABV2B4I7_9GAMM
MSIERLPRRTTAHSAFWMMVRRVTVLAACVDVALFCFFLAVGSPILAWINVISVSLYLVAYRLLQQRRNRAALILIWTEVLGHAVLGTLLTGWGAGFNYYLLMFIPAIMVSGNWRTVVPPLLVLFAAYVGLHEVSRFYGALEPLGATALTVLYVFNISVFFAMASSTARFYYAMVRKTEGKLRDLATRDTLTGLFNRRHLMELAHVERRRADHEDVPLSLVIADIDDFKQINDRLGHDAGDLVLRQVGEALRESCRSHDTVARWGGEEFLFLLPQTSAEAARDFAERVRRAVEALGIGPDAQSFHCTVSLGVATLDADESLEEAIGRADHALYRSKAEGRNRVTAATLEADVALGQDSAQVIDLHPEATGLDGGPEDRPRPGGVPLAG